MKLKEVTITLNEFEAALLSYILSYAEDLFANETCEDMPKFKAFSTEEQIGTVRKIDPDDFEEEYDPEGDLRPIEYVQASTVAHYLIKKIKQGKKNEQRDS